MHRNILRLAIPSIISNITTPLLGLVDVAITGHMADPRYMAAIAVGSMVFNILYWLFAFLRFGTGGMTAQSYGEQDTEECKSILLKAGATCMAVAIVILLLQSPLFHLMMWFIEPEDALLPIVHSYYKICIWGVLPSLSLYAFTGWFVGMQNTVLPMVISITQNIVNIGLSCLFVYGFHMKIEGVALGTLLAGWTGMAMAILMLCRRYSAMFKDVSLKGAVCFKDMKRFFDVNRTLFYRTLFLVAVNLYVIEAGARGGAIILAVNSVLMQLFILYTYVMDGFAFAAEALCGRFYGAHDRLSFQKALKGIWMWSIALTIAYTLAYAICGREFLELLTNDETIRHVAKDYLPWASLIPICGIAAFVWDGVFVGITNTRGMLWGTFCGATSFFVIYFSLYPYMENHALWLAFCAYLLFRGVAEHIIYKHESSKLFNL